MNMLTKTPRDAAMALHSDIMATARTAAEHIVELCRLLKKMRDEKLYTELGFESFGDYAEQAVGIRQRQAYNYIGIYEKLSPKLLKENAELGVTKLSLLSQVSAPDREDFVQENDLAGMTVAEIKALVEEKNGLAQQVSMLEAEQTAADSDRDVYKAEADRLRAALEKKEAELEALKKEPIEAQGTQMTAEIEKALAEQAKKAQQEQSEAVKKAVKAEKEKARAAQEKAVAAAKSEAEKAAAEKQKAEMERLREKAEAERKRAEETAARMEKELRLAHSEQTARFSVLFEDIAEKMNQALALLAGMPSEQKDMVQKMGNALRTLLSEVSKQIPGGAE